ncbi:leucine-rich repeat domain-containing protein [Flavobacterium aquidurense]|uniref:Internalin-related protein n=1 Tax=Flavobacterium aquidurense TaxID=362413 RepID=A0A0Q1BN44_9FLAO|nr:leucine-rich repeat domain-containing protein [Flavobacterium aquidurense]KQB42262.1 Internalin-related protein [Flavobacterium aquidurense]
MKKIYFLVLALSFFNGLYAQIISIPDTNFKDKLLSSALYSDIAKDLNGNKIKIDSNGNGEIEISEAEKISELYLNENVVIKRIASLTGILYFKNLKKITLEYGNLSTLDLAGLDNLETLSIEGNQQLKSINLSGLNNLKILDLYGCKLTTLDLSTLSNLENLDCTGCRLTNIDVSDSFNLKTLNCSYNLFTSLSIAGLSKLNNLVCSNNPITDLNLQGLDNLQFLECDYTNLTTLTLNGFPKLENVLSRWGTLTSIKISNLPNLKRLECFYNNITDFDVTNTSKLEWLSCGNNNISNLDISAFNELKFSNCETNKISSLETNNLSKLEVLYCGINKFTSLDVQSSPNLQTLSCSNNQIKILNLENLPKLLEVNCSYNQIEALDFNSAKKISQITCNNNNLVYLFVKNGKQEGLGLYDSFSYYNNPNLKYICADDTDIEQIEYYLANNNMPKVNLNTYCSFTPGGDFYTIQALNKFDQNNDGCDLNDVVVYDIKYNVTSNLKTGVLVSNNSKIPSIELQQGNYKIIPVLQYPEYFNISPKEITVSFPNDASPRVENFCITAVDSRNDLEIILVPGIAAEPGFESTYNIVYKNNGNTTQSGFITVKFDDTVLHYVSSDKDLISKSGNELKWDFNNLKPFESGNITFTLYLNRPTDKPAANIGDILKFSTNISSLSLDETPLNNLFELKQTVVGSYDPNDKTCLEGTIITPNLIGEYVHYMIRFENTGTSRARNIVVKDMIDLAKFDISTLVPISSSHSFVTKISDGNKVEFIFENINLPFDDANNDGYIAFKIKTKPTLKVGDTFANEANIYFDYNFPILTNKATSKFETTLETSDFEFSNYFTLYPNPASDILNFNTKQDITIQSLVIYDILGQLVIAVPNAKSATNIDVSKLRTGNYFIKVKSDKGSSSIKFIKR